jgi:Glyoxalase-like domain
MDRGVASLPRLRQVALVAADLDAACADVEAALGLSQPFHDPGVELFGLANAVYEVGDTFLEIVSPRQAGTTAGRYLERRRGDAGYMAIFQVADTAAARDRARAAGLRTAWQIDLDDISGTHLHPGDVPGAIVSFDTPRPVASWRWAGPRWTGGAPDDRLAPSGGIVGLTVRLLDVESSAGAWASVVGARVDSGVMTIEGGRQQVRFEATSDPDDEGIATVEIAGLTTDASIANVTFTAPPAV